jgi:hypothetical protein
MSADGRVVVFASDSEDVVPEASATGFWNVFAVTLPSGIIN